MLFSGYLRYTLLGGLVFLAACQKNQPITNIETVDGARLAAADKEPQNWLTHGRTWAEDRFSPLDQINTKNVARLGLAWFQDLDTHRGQEATPLIVDGVLYVSTAWSKVKAYKADSGELLWSYDPKVPGKWGARGCCDVVNRGVAVWRGKVFIGTFDGRLVALDAKNGTPLWEVSTIDRSKSYTITGAPRVVKGKVIIGNGGAEYGVRGYVSAYDAETGTLAWRFYTVPGDPSKPFENPILAKAAKTWSGDWWKLGGGGTVWDSMAYDPELDLLYIGVGNGSPWNQGLRSPGGGDNLFLSSIVALRPETGAYVWHYQTTPGTAWDYTATQQMILADLTIDGRRRKVIMQAPKNGFFYVLDRRTGKLISARPFVPVNWASRVDLKTGRPVINPRARYWKTGKPWLGMPGPLGGHNWQSMSYDWQTGLVYLPAQELPFPYVADRNFTPSHLAVNLGVDLEAASLPQDAATKKAVKRSAKGYLLAWDPVAQKEVWRVSHGGPWNGGVLSTAGGLVFQGTAAGVFSAYRAQTGEKLWSFAAQTGVVAAPVSFMVDGVQYISVVVGWGGVFPLLTGEIAWVSGKETNRSRVLTFRLGGDKTLPALPAAVAAALHPPAAFGSAAMIARGKARYHRYCGSCHGDAAVSGGVLPDLRYSSSLADAGAWAQIVLKGLLEGNGMISFASELASRDAKEIRSYVVMRARQTAEKTP